ncbi:MAG: cytochrome P450 [Halioglobus sp.]|nr:cytochrome P450 [Halioglobus sp.]
MTQCPFTHLLDLDTYVNGMPYAELATLRQQGSFVHFDDPDTGVPYWAAVKRDALDFVSQNPDLFSSNLKGPFPIEMSPEEAEIQAVMFDNFIIAMDPPKHMNYRKVVRDAFSPRAVAEMEPWLREQTRMIIDRVVHKGECEFVEEVAAELPLIAILEILGVPIEDRKQFFEWTNTMAFADDPDITTDPQAAQLASIEVITYAMNLARKAATEGTDRPVLKALLEGEVEGKKITEDMFAWMFLLIMVGGNESTRTTTAHGMRLLIEHPDQLQYLVEHPQDIPMAVEEIIRYNTAFITMRRTATQDIEWNGYSFKKGDKIILHYHAVNHDEDVFGDDAMVFDIHRHKRLPNIRRELRSFGIGEHFCLGMNLARLELNVIFEELIPRIRNPKFAGDVTYMRSIFINTIKGMPISFDAA